MSFLQAGREVQKFVLDRVKGKPEETLQAVLDARRFNSMIVETDMGYGPGKLRSLKISYYAPDCADDGECGVNICEAGRKIEPKQVFFTIGECTASDVITLAMDDIRLVDGNYTFSTHAKQMFLSLLPTVRGRLAAAVVAKLAANAGVLPNGNASQNLPMINPANGAINPVGLWTIEKAYRDTGYSNPFIVGGGEVWSWKKATEIGGLNQLGQELSRLGSTNMYYDSRVTTFYGGGSEHILSFDPEMIKFVSYSDNAGMFATDLTSIDDLDRIFQRGGTDYIFGSFYDPMYGILWDFDVVFDPCTKTWNMQIRLKWDLFIMPPMVCNDVQGVNGIFHWLTCPPTVYECPEGSPIIPATEATYEFDASAFTYPLYVGQLTVGGQTSNPNVTVADAAALKDLMNANYNGVTFTITGTDIQYEGVTAISFKVNGGSNNTFAAA